jgi:hypothetical protein
MLTILLIYLWSSLKFTVQIDFSLITQEASMGENITGQNYYILVWIQAVVITCYVSIVKLIHLKDNTTVFIYTFSFQVSKIKVKMVCIILF